MAADTRHARKADGQGGAGGLQPSSDTPSTALRAAGTTQLTDGPIGGADEPSHELDHLIGEIDEVFGFARPSLARRGTNAVPRS
jgi:hypothetical protein